MRERSPGLLGSEIHVKLEVRMIADIGLIGFPNAGKSTFISSVTRSKPKIASYEFTTINPNLGQIKFVDDRNITIVDIPGLVEDSSKNKGLGHQFLSHCLKAKSLAFLIDMSTDQKIAPWDQYRILKHELEQYSSSFAEKKYVVVGTKADLPGTESSRQQFERVTGEKVVMVSAKDSQNLSMIVRKFRSMVYGDAEDGIEDLNIGN